MNTLDELGYDVADAEATGKDDPKIVDGKHFLPQHRERIVLVGFRRDLQLKQDFTLRNIDRFYPRSRPTFGELLEPTVDAKYVLSPKLWDYLFHYAKKHAAKGNGFGFGLVDPLMQPAWHEPYLPAITKMAQKFWSIAAGIKRWVKATLATPPTSSVVRAG
jgi:DNA (cytosine-5)-methyltransferase 1